MESPRGRATGLRPKNRFEQLHVDQDPEQNIDTEYFVDASRSVLAANTSPDVGFTYSLNPYRGCEHGCVYCYARPSHEFLGWSAGVDFESRILVKSDAPDLLDRALREKRWKPQTVALSGNTDCYQPVERRLELTRRCLAVFFQHRNPVTIITKNHLVTRDVDILRQLSRYNLVTVTLSVTSLVPELAKRMEPRASGPRGRLRAIEELARHEIPVGVNIAPLIPGLNDPEIPSILRECRDRGARWASYILLRLPGAVQPIFVEWLDRNYPERSGRVLNKLRMLRDGALSDARFGTRMSGTGKHAELIESFFNLQRDRYNYNPPPALATHLFRRGSSPAQLELRLD